MVNGITEEDKAIAFENIVLHLLLLSLEKDITIIQSSRLKLGDIHLELLKKVQNAVIKDIQNNKRLMKQKGIKVFEKNVVSEEFWQYSYLIRGYNSEFRCFTYALKMHVANKLRQYYALN